MRLLSAIAYNTLHSHLLGRFVSVDCCIRKANIMRCFGHSLACPQVSTEKLALKLLRLAPNTPPGKHLLMVNFDPALVNLLRETKYFIALGTEVPEAARGVYDRSKTFRRHIGALDLIVAVWNRVQNTILPVELPLVRAQIDELHTRLDDGLKTLDWNSPTIDKYIDEVKVRLLRVVKIVSIFEKFCF